MCSHTWLVRHPLFTHTRKQCFHKHQLIFSSGSWFRAILKPYCQLTLYLTCSLQTETNRYQQEEEMCNFKWVSFYNLRPQKALKALYSYLLFIVHRCWLLPKVTRSDTSSFTFPVAMPREATALYLKILSVFYVSIHIHYIWVKFIWYYSKCCSQRVNQWKKTVILRVSVAFKDCRQEDGLLMSKCVL